jgi:hypothetical protein
MTQASGRSPWKIIVIIALALLVLAAGCTMAAGMFMKNAMETAIKMQTGVDVDSDGNSMTFNDGENEVTITGTGDDGPFGGPSDEPVDLPDGFPSDFPVAEGMVAYQAATVNHEEGVGYMVMWRGEADVAAAMREQERLMKAAGWGVVMSNDSGDGGQLMLSLGDPQDPDMSAVLTFSREDDETVMHLILGDERP